MASGLIVASGYPTTTSFTTTLAAGGTYRWNVAADNSSGESSFTTPLYFQTPAAIPPTPTGPSPGTTSSPGPMQASTTVTLSWNASSGATYYDVGVRDMASGLIVASGYPTTTSFTTTLAAGGTYRWNVAADNSSGESSFTTPLYFQTPIAATVPATPTGTSPGLTSSPGPMQASATVTLSWNASSGATYYDVGVRDLTSGTIVASGYPTTTSFTTTLTAGRTYRWNVAAGNSAGESTFTTPLYFQTPISATIPATPTSPGPGTTSSPGPVQASTTVALSWDASAGATYYDLGVRDIASGNLVVSTTTTVPNYTTTLTAGKTYRWNVAAGNSAGESTFTTPLYFQTPASITVPATPTSPSPGTTSSPGPMQANTTVVLSWGASAGATYYSLGVRDVASGNLVVSTTTTLPNYTATLSAGKTYRWNVAAGNSAGLSPYTTVVYFQTPAVITPTLSVTPANPQTASAAAGTIPYYVSIAGGDTMTYSATPLDTWLHISSGSPGVYSGTIIVSYDQNTGGQRSGTVQFTASGASGSPLQVTITQTAANGGTTQVLGLDVAAAVNWSAVNGIRFAYLKATESTYSPDGDFSANTGGAIGQGIKVGAYHFATPLFSPAFYQATYDHTDTALQEAHHFVDAAEGVIGSGFLPPALDVEEQVVTWNLVNGKYVPAVWVDPLTGNSHDNAKPPNPLPNQPAMGAAALAQWINDWVSTVETLTHTVPVIYCDRTYAKALSPYFCAGSVKLWIADINHPAGSPVTTGWEAWPWIFHQYSWTGSAGGTTIDLDIFKGDSTAFTALLNGGASPQQYTVTPSPGANGTVTPSTPQTVPTLGGVTFSASPTTISGASQFTQATDASSDYVVDQWLVNGIPAQSGGTNFTLLNVTADTQVQVTFKPAPAVSYTVTLQATTDGTISPSSDQLIVSGDSITVTALPDAGYAVDQWLVNGLSAQTGGTTFTLVNVTTPTTVQVTFGATPNGTACITATPVPAYGGTVNGGGVFLAGGQQTVTAEANPGYSFINWTENGMELSALTSYTFTLTDNRTVVANFTAIPAGLVGDTNAPALQITQPYSIGIFVTTNNAVTVMGTATDLGHGDNGISIVTVNDIEAVGDTTANGGTANWGLPVTLSLGTNVFTIIAKDNSPNTNATTIILLVYYQLQPPFEDSVGDGILDAWRAEYFPNVDPTGTTTNSVSCATCDPDGDGLSNLQEFLAGTDPTNSISTFRITSISNIGPDNLITWTVVSGKTYVVQLATNGFVGSLTNTFNDLAAVVVPPAAAIAFTNYLDVGGATDNPSRFYRIRLGP
jgi:GH25 family lysozyme M1 (1,4-beta-N-acetylmuramidase)/uncharacterized protein YegP (UPF0339 family)